MSWPSPPVSFKVAHAAAFKALADWVAWLTENPRTGVSKNPGVYPISLWKTRAAKGKTIQYHETLMRFI